MYCKTFNLLHSSDWKVLKVIQFTYRRYSCMTTGTILYERTYKYEDYNENSNDVVDETIKKGIASLFGTIDCNSYIIQWAGEEDDFKMQYCIGKHSIALTIRCMPIVDIKPANVDREKKYEGFDFDFNIYLDYVEKELSLPSLLTVVGYNPNDQKTFVRVSQLLKEL